MLLYYIMYIYIYIYYIISLLFYGLYSWDFKKITTVQNEKKHKNAGPGGDENGRRINQHGRGVVVDVDGQPNGVEKDDPLDVAGDVDGKHANANGSHKKYP